jgi:hypothetical protein
MYGK